MGEHWNISRKVAELVVMAGVLALCWHVGQAGAASTASCETAGSDLIIAVSGSTTASQPLTVAVSAGSYVVSLGGASPASCVGISDATYPNVQVQGGTANQYAVLDDSDGQLASTGAGCPVSITFSFSSSATNKLDILGVSAPSNAADATVGLGAAGLTLSEGGCSSPDVNITTGVQDVLIEGQAPGSALDLSGVTNSLTVNAEADIAADLGGVTGVTNGDLSLVQFYGEQTIIGSNSSSTTFQPGTASGLTFVGAHGVANTLDLTNEPAASFSTLTVAAASDTPASQGQLTSTGSGSIADSFANVTTIDGASAVPTTFQPGTASGLTFVGAHGVANTLDLTNEPTASFSTLTVAAASDTPASQGQLTSTGSGSIADSFANVTTIDGASAVPTTFQPGTASGLTFVGAHGVANTLDLTNEPTASFSTLTVAAASDTPASQGQLTSTGSGSIADSFANVTTIDGASAVPTTFQPGTASGLTFVGAHGVANTLDLTNEPAASFSTLAVAMSGAAACAGMAELTSTGAAGNIGDCFTRIATVDGASAVPTDFEPDPNLLATTSPTVLFVGNDPGPGGSVIDLGRFTSPDSSGDTVTGLTVSLGANSQAGPGQVSAGVNANPVVFAQFYDVDTAVGSGSIPTVLEPGTAEGVSLINITPAPQVISFTSSPPSPARVGATYTPAATGGGSGDPVVFTIDPASTAKACSLKGTTVTFDHTGTCVIDANQAGDSEYQSAVQVHQTITIVAATKPAVRIDSRAILSIHGTVAIRVSCPAGQTSCAGAIRIVTQRAFATSTAGRKATHKHRSRLMLGDSHLTIAGGHTATVEIRLKQSARRLLATHKSLMVLISVTAHNGTGQTATTHRAVRLT